MKPIIEVENVTKLYRLGSVGPTSVRDLLDRWFEKKRKPIAEQAGDSTRRDNPEEHTFWALRDISFTVQPGEVVGVIGRNGAGKSTLLKVLSRITEPTSGRATLRGRVASLLEVGTGFHPELTGRENIYLNGAILGMKRAEITKVFDEIVAFSEVNTFIDTPVKRYSSGMYVRLAFAVAAHLQPEILIIDEVLAVGDTAFQKKCLGKMSDVAKGGRTVLFVSHNMAAVQALCTTALLLEDGKVVASGPTEPVLARYLQEGGEDSNVWKRDPALPTTPLQFEGAEARLEGLPPRQMLKLELKLRSTENHRPGFIAVDVLNSLGSSIMQALPTVTAFIDARHGTHTVQLDIELPSLIPGHYSLALWVGPHNTETFDYVERAIGFEIEKSPTRNRTYAHTTDHGYIVPHSTCTYLPGAVPEPILVPV